METWPCSDSVMATSSRISGSQAPGSSSQLTASPKSLLSQLRDPTRSELMRKRKVRVNAPLHTGARKKKGPACSTDLKEVNAAHKILVHT